MNKKMIVIMFWGLIVAGSPAKAEEWIYYVQKGDTLWDLCVEYLDTTNVDQCWRKIKKYNSISVPKRMQPGSFLHIPLDWLKKIPTAATVQFSAGEVHYVAFEETTPIPVKTGDKIPIGARLMIGDGAVVLEFTDGSELLLRHNTELLIEALTTHGNKYARSSLHLDGGGVDIKATRDENNNHFQVVTPGVVAAVRGTEFRVTVSPDGLVTQTEVLEGRVDVAADRVKHSVAAGYGVSARKGERLQPPETLLPAPEIDGSGKPFTGPVAVVWRSVPEAVNYELELYSGSEGRNIIQQVQTGSHEFVFVDLADGFYRVVVRAVALNGLRGQDSQHTFRVMPELAAPILLEDDVGYTDGTLQFSWNSVPAATSYRVELSDRESFDQIVHESEVTDAAVSIKTDVDDGIYVRVMAISDDGRESQYSNSIYKKESNDGLIVAVVSTLAVILALL